MRWGNQELPVIDVSDAVRRRYFEEGYDLGKDHADKRVNLDSFFIGMLTGIFALFMMLTLIALVLWCLTLIG